MHPTKSRPGFPAAAAVTLSVLIAACSSAATPVPAEAPGPPTAAPTAAPTVAPTATVTAAPTATSEALTQTITAKAGGRSIRYPGGWIAADNLGIIYLASSQAANDRLIGLGSLGKGEMMIQFAENSILGGATSDPAVHLPANLRLLAEGMGITLGAPVAMTSTGRLGARIDASNDRLGMIAISLKVRDDLFADVIAYMPPDEMASREAIVLAIVETLAYPPA